MKAWLHVLCAIGAGFVLSAAAGAEEPVFPHAPKAAIDLATVDGVALLNGEWRYSDTRIVEASFKSAGADGQPTGRTVKNYDYEPRSGGRDYDDPHWEIIAADSLSKRRGNGRLGFNWYRINLTVPARVGDFVTAGSTAVFETALDDYSEIWVDGEYCRRKAPSSRRAIRTISRGAMPTARRFI
ncbi:MAG: hypothetical protein ACR2FI_10300 [Burkholderiales bacterium]|nr:hypothetical protein [Pseudomonadota bacterium]